MSKKAKLIKEQVFSHVEDKNIKTNLDGSTIWGKCKHFEDVTDEEKEKGGFVYTILFEGPKPIQVASVRSV